MACFQRIQAAHDALVGVGSDAGTVLPFGCAQCPSRGGVAASRKDVVRCILVAPDWGWLTLDEQQVLVITAEGQRVAAEAPPGVTLLCCCFLEERRRFAVGGSKGYLLVISLDAAAAPPTPVPLGTAAPVLALAAPEWTDQSPYLFASVDGDVLAIDLDEGSVLCSLGARAALRAEALLCARIPPLEPEAEETFPPEPLLLAAGGDPDEGAAGVLSLLRARAPCAEGDAEGAELVWRAEHELPIFAVALAPSPPAAAGGGRGGGGRGGSRGSRGGAAAAGGGLRHGGDAARRLHRRGAAEAGRGARRPAERARLQPVRPLPPRGGIRGGGQA